MNETQTHPHCSAVVTTPQAARYLAQLCKHFQHKLPVTLGEASGHIAFPFGDCRLTTKAGPLVLSLEAPDDERLVQLQNVVARHLVRFAFREDLHIDWQDA